MTGDDSHSCNSSLALEAEIIGTVSQFYFNIHRDRQELMLQLEAAARVPCLCTGGLASPFGSVRKGISYGIGRV